MTWMNKTGIKAAAGLEKGVLTNTLSLGLGFRKAAAYTSGREEKEIPGTWRGKLFFPRAKGTSPRKKKTMTQNDTEKGRGEG